MNVESEFAGWKDQKENINFKKGVRSMFNFRLLIRGKIKMETIETVCPRCGVDVIGTCLRDDEPTMELCSPCIEYIKKNPEKYKEERQIGLEQDFGILN
jgi:hypothetical protein